MTDAHSVGTKDGTSEVSNKSALKEAVEQLQNALEASDELGMPQVFCTRETARAVLATLSSQAEVMAAMASALEPFEKAAEKLDGRWHEDDWRWNDSVRSNVTVREIRQARTILSQYRSLNGDA